ncbi:MAG: hypothetical protein E7519_11925 [Ruminococcaceae bacterium]|nr:hypothetical protein [Oscillospiraceae bacterium]
MADSKEEISLSYELDVKELLNQAVEYGKETGELLKEAISDSLSDLGDRISAKFEYALDTALPGISEGFKKISESLSSTNSDFQDFAEKLAANLGPSQAQMIQDFASKVGATVDTATNAANFFGTAIDQMGNMRTALSGVSQGLQTFKAAGGGLEGVSKALQSVFSLGPQQLVFLAIAAIATLAVVIFKNWGPISAFFQNLWNTLQAGAKVLGTWFTGTFLHYFQDTWNNIKAFVVGIPAYFTNLWSVLTGGMTNLWNTISAVVKKMVQPLVQSILTPFTGLQTTFKQIMTGVQNIFTGTFTLLKNIILGPILLICDLISGNFGKILPDLIKIFTNIQNALKQIWTGIQQYFRGVFTVIGTIFTSTWNGFVSIVTTTGTKIKTGITTLWDSIISWFRSLPATLMQIGAKMFESMKSGIDSTIHTVVSAVQTGIGQAIDWIKDLPHQALQWGKDIIGGIVDGIKSAADAVGNAVKGIAQDIRKFLHFSVPDEGPLVDFPTWMPDMMKGLALGILENKSLVTAALMDLAGAMSVGLSVTPALAVSGGGSAFAAQQQGTLFAAGISRPVIDYHPTFQSPKALSPVEIARQERQNAQRLSLFLRRR